MKWDIKSLRLEDAKKILNFEKDLLLKLDKDEIEVSMLSWSSRWRQEALEYYLPKGWSFGVFKDGELLGYVIANVLPFFRGYTQVLWVEHLNAIKEEYNKVLIDLVYKSAREKHLQMIFIENLALSSFPEQNYGGESLAIEGQFFKTTKNKD